MYRSSVVSVWVWGIVSAALVNSGGVSSHSCMCGGVAGGDGDLVKTRQSWLKRSAEGTDSIAMLLATAFPRGYCVSVRYAGRVEERARSRG